LQSSWKRAREAAGLEHFTLHDIRATGLTLAAQSGATLPELMSRAGHTTSRAALIYQRTASERAATVANNMDATLRAFVGA
jgi:integrase